MKKTIFSGIQPTGAPTLGTYQGAIKNWRSLQDEYNCFYCVVDMHAITVRQDPGELRENARDLLTLFIACGLDPEKSVLYYQSHVPAHAELAWILNCFAYMGELGRMTQFKEKSQKQDNISAGLFIYPVLQAADILLYQSDLVPVGEDQRQHLELSRDIAQRFNNIHGDTFTVPEAYIGKLGARIMGLQDPDKKMSKSESDNDNNLIYLLDEPDQIRNKIKRAKTDSGSEVRYDPSKPGIMNLLDIYCSSSEKSVTEAEKDFEGINYGKFKEAVGDAVVTALEPVRKRYRELSQEKGYIDSIIRKNGQRAAETANKTLSEAKKKVGFPNQYL